MQRRTFIRHLGGAAAYCSLAAHPTPARSSRIPVVGFLSALTREPETSLGALRRGLDEAGFREGETVTVNYRWAKDNYDRLPTMAAELSQLDPAVIVAANYPAAVAVRRATSTIPIVFISAIDPVTSGLVASLNRPGGNATGIYILNGLLEAERLEMLRQVVPALSLGAVLVNPKFPEAQRKILRQASRELGVYLLIVEVSSQPELSGVFGALAARRVEGLIVTTDPLLYTYRDDIVRLAAHHRIPAIYPFVEFVQLGGLMSYATDLPAAFHQVGAYVGRILKGEKPTELPVYQSTTVALTLNLNTAKALGITFSETLQARADDIIE